MTWWGWLLAGAFAVLYFFARACASKIIGDEARARADDLPQVILDRAIRRLPEDVRDFYREDWEGNILAALNDSTVRYPATRLWKSTLFAFSLMVDTRRIRKEIGYRSRLLQVCDACLRWTGAEANQFFILMFVWGVGLLLAIRVIYSGSSMQTLLWGSAAILFGVALLAINHASRRQQSRRGRHTPSASNDIQE